MDVLGGGVPHTDGDQVGVVVLTHPSTQPILSHKLNYIGCMSIFTTLSIPFLG